MLKGLSGPAVVATPPSARLFFSPLGLGPTLSRVNLLRTESTSDDKHIRYVFLHIICSEIYQVSGVGHVGACPLMFEPYVCIAKTRPWEALPIIAPTDYELNSDDLARCLSARRARPPLVFCFSRTWLGLTAPPCRRGLKDSPFF